VTQPRLAAAVLALVCLGPALPSAAWAKPSSCATLAQCVDELRQNPRDQELRDRVLEMTLAASTSTAAPAASVGGGAERAAVLERFKKLAQGEYKGVYQCGRLSPLMAMQRRERMDCDQAEFEAGRWHLLDALGTFVFRFPKDGTIEFWNVRGFGFGNALMMVGAPRGPEMKEIEWRSCGRGRNCKTPVWVSLGSGLRTVTVSPDKPSDGSPVDPKARYAYAQYRRE
jgi:hypothetical protein